MTKPSQLLKGFEKTVVTVRPKPKQQVIYDEGTTGLALIVSPKGKKVFAVIARDPTGKQVWKRFGSADAMTVDEARVAARQAVARIKAGESEILPTSQAPPETFREVAERFVKRWVDKGGKKQDGVPLRSKREIERQLKTYAYPRWQDKPFASIRRGTVTQLMDELVDHNGAVQADRVLATLSKLFNWYRIYDEDYISPVIPEMKRSGSHADRARDRVLSDDEIRTVWQACGKIGTFGAMVQVALLTAQRRAKVQVMRWDEIEGGVWTIPSEAREKVNAGSLQLPPTVLTIIEAQPRIEGNPYVFAGRGKKAFHSFSDGMEDLRAQIAKANEGRVIPHWVIHDLRRTAKTLMRRAGVDSEISERVLGHVIGGVEGVYDRHDYADEKGRALKALAGLVRRILDQSDGKVVPLKKHRQTH